MEFKIVTAQVRCNFHPKSKFLEVKKGENESYWCLECLYKMLLESKGTWHTTQEYLNETGKDRL